MHTTLIMRPYMHDPTIQSYHNQLHVIFITMHIIYIYLEDRNTCYSLMHTNSNMNC